MKSRRDPARRCHATISSHISELNGPSPAPHDHRKGKGISLPASPVGRQILIVLLSLVASAGPRRSAFPPPSLNRITLRELEKIE